MNNGFFLSIFFLIISANSYTTAQSFYTEGVLEDLDFITGVSVGKIDQQLKDDGLDTEFLETAVALKLIDAGINVDITGTGENNNYKSVVSSPELVIVINSVKDDVYNLYILAVNLVLLEDVKLLRSDKTVRSATWQAGISAIIPADKTSKIKQPLKELCDIFINDYLKENPEQ